jgi:transposase
MRLLFTRRLTRNERDAVYGFIDDKEAGYRALIIALSHEGQEVREIARKLNMHPDNVRKWIRRFNKQGLKCLHSKAGRKPKFHRSVEKKLLRLAIMKPHKLNLPFSTWSLRKLEYYAKKKLGVDVSYVQIGKILAKHGLRFRKARRKLVSDDPEYEAKMARIRRLLRKPNSVVLFEDERALVAKEYLGYEWCFKAREVKANQRIKGKVYLYGFLDAHSKRFHARFFDELRKKNFFTSLGWISRRIGDLVYLILDNSPAHPKSHIDADMKKVPENMRLVFLPKHSPKDNRVEDVFSLVQKEVLDNRKFSGTPEVIVAVRKWIRNFNRKALRCN